MKKIYVILLLALVYSNAIFSQNPRKVAVGGNTYIVSNYMVNNVTNKLSVSNFINKERFTASPNQEVAIAARNVFYKNRINALKKTKDAILINFYIDKNGGIKEVSFNVAHAQNVTLQELNLLEAYLKKHYVFSISSKSDSTSDYLVGIPLWFVKL